MRRSILVAAGAGLLLSTGLTVPAHAADGAQLAVLHAVPDLPVDVYVDGKLTIDDFQPGALGGPLALDAGTYSVAITAADAEDDSDPAIGPIDLELSDGGNYTAVAHLDADGEPTATLFENEVGGLDAGQGRLTVRHTAAAPAVDVLAGGKAVVSDLANPDEKSLELPAGTVSAAVAAAGTEDPVIGPADVTVADGSTTIVYAWGSLDDDNLALAVQTLNSSGQAPAGVGAGESGLAASTAPGVIAAVGVLAMGLALLLRRRPAARVTR